MHPGLFTQNAVETTNSESKAPAIPAGRRAVRFHADSMRSSSPEASTSTASSFEFNSEDDEDEEDLAYWSNPSADGVERDLSSWAGSLPATQGLYDPENEKGEHIHILLVPHCLIPVFLILQMAAVSASYGISCASTGRQLSVEQ